MQLRMGSQLFNEVTVPLLWGTRAILQDQKGRISIIDLSGAEAKLEILGGKPAPNVEYRPISEGAIEILRDSTPLYSFNPNAKIIRGLALKLPECEIREDATRIGTSIFSNNTVSGFGVGIKISEHGLTIGGPLPPELAKLRA